MPQYSTPEPAHADDELSEKLIPPSAGQNMEVYLVFEGGGVKGGLAHLGALWALDRIAEEVREAKANGSTGHWPDFKIKGVAGTSIGSIIAALIASGYHVGEIMGRNGHAAIFDGLKIKLTGDLFPAKSVEHLKKANFFLSDQTRPQAVKLVRNFAFRVYVSCLVACWLTVCAALAVVGPDQHVDGMWSAVTAAADFMLQPGRLFAAAILSTLIALPISFIWIIIVVRRIFKGLVGTEGLEFHLKRAMAIKISQGSVEKLKKIAPAELKDAHPGPTFEDLAASKGLPLRIVATELRDQTFTLFSDRDTPKVSVARSVAASMAIPIVFKPVAVVPNSSKRYHDGGANLQFARVDLGSDPLIRGRCEGPVLRDNPQARDATMVVASSLQ